jgi:hypothetical protein
VGDSYPLGSVITADVRDYENPNLDVYTDLLLVKADNSTESWYSPVESEWFAFAYLRNIREVS